MSRINEKIITDYHELQKKLPHILDAYSINIVDLCRQTGMNRSTFYNKIGNQSFTIEEMKLISKYLNR
jgi:predicted transcriptional regulator